MRLGGEEGGGLWSRYKVYKEDKLLNKNKEVTLPPKMQTKPEVSAGPLLLYSEELRREQPGSQDRGKELLCRMPTSAGTRERPCLQMSMTVSG